MKEERPWGHFEVLLDEKGYKLKRLVVSPGKRLSYQSHSSRSEAWSVAKGEALLTLDGRERKLYSGDMVLIGKKVKHRVENIGADDLVIIELQFGDRLSEDDIIRYDDDYGRA